MCAVVYHNIEPLFDSESKILLLGSMPSPKSREQKFYYAHPQNRFWKVLSAVLSQPLPLTVSAKKSMLLSNRIALWDVIGSCEITGASDSTIRNPVPNDYSRILKVANIRQIFTLGRTATYYFEKLSGLKSVYLPSTSPANNTVSLEKLIEEFSIILKYLK